MTTQTQDTFILRTDFYPQIKMLSMEQRGHLLTAIFAYSAGEEMPEMDQVTAMGFGFIKASLDSNAERYQAKCARNRENGGRGGRPSSKPNGSTNNRTVSEKTERFSEKATAESMSDEKANGFSENPIDIDIDFDFKSDSDFDSESLSLRDTAAGAREREEFLKILLFEKKVLCPQVELERFLNHYAKCGWVDANGNPIRNRAAALKAWTPAKDVEKCPKRICDIWATLYAAVRTADPECDATPMLAPFMGLSFDGANVYVTARDLTLRNFLETPEHLPALRSVLAAQFGADKKLIYRTPRK